MIIIVEDRRGIGEAFVRSFRRLGVTAVRFTAGDCRQWLETSGAQEIAAIDGVLVATAGERSDLLRRLCRDTGAPVIAVNDEKSLDDTLDLLEIGVDDVVAKPVHVRELLARLEAVRRRGPVHAEKNADGQIRVFADGRDPIVGGEALALPRRERRILECLFRVRGQWVEKDKVFRQVYGPFEENASVSVVESHVCRLRKRLRERLGSDIIEAQRFLGYRLAGKIEAKHDARPVSARDPAGGKTCVP